MASGMIYIISNTSLVYSVGFMMLASDSCALNGRCKSQKQSHTVIAADFELVYLFSKLVLLYRLCSWHRKWETPLEVLHLIHVAGPEVLWRMQEQCELMCYFIWDDDICFVVLSTWKLSWFYWALLCFCLLKCSRSIWDWMFTTFQRDLPLFWHRLLFYALSERQVWCCVHKNSKITSLHSKVRDLSMTSNISN